MGWHGNLGHWDSEQDQENALLFSIRETERDVPGLECEEDAKYEEEYLGNSAQVTCAVERTVRSALSHLWRTRFRGMIWCIWFTTSNREPPLTYQITPLLYITGSTIGMFRRRWTDRVIISPSLSCWLKQKQAELQNRRTKKFSCY